MKTSTMLLIGGAAVVGYLYAKKRAATLTGAQTQGISAAAPAPTPAPTVVVNVEDDDYGPGWGWGTPVWGARSWGGFGRGHGHGHHGGHGGHHGGHH